MSKLCNLFGSQLIQTCPNMSQLASTHPNLPNLSQLNPFEVQNYLISLVSNSSQVAISFTWCNLFCLVGFLLLSMIIT